MFFAGNWDRRRRVRERRTYARSFQFYKKKFFKKVTGEAERGGEGETNELDFTGWFGGATSSTPPSLSRRHVLPFRRSARARRHV